MKGKAIALVLVLMFIMALAAGAAIALLVQSHGALPTAIAKWFPNPPPSSVPAVVRGNLSDILHLTAAQNAQMQQIWLDVSKVSTECMEDAKTIQADEDNELRDQILTTNELKEQFQALRNKSKVKLDALAKKRDTAFRAGVEKSMKVLNEEQRPIYEQILHDRVGKLPELSTGGSSQVCNPQDIAPITIGDDVQMDLGSSHMWHLPDRASYW